MDKALMLLIISLEMSNQKKDSNIFLKSTEAYTRQFKLDDMAFQWSEKHINRELKTYINDAAIIVKSVTDQKIIYKWEF